MTVTLHDDIDQDSCLFCDYQFKDGVPGIEIETCHGAFWMPKPAPDFNDNSQNIVNYNSVLQSKNTYNIILCQDHL